MNPSEVADELAKRVIHPAWLDVGRNFFKQGFIHGYQFGYGQAPVYVWLLVGITLGFILGKAV